MSKQLLTALLAMSASLNTQPPARRRSMPKRKGDMYTFQINGVNIEAVNMQQAQKRYNKLFSKK